MRRPIRRKEQTNTVPQFDIITLRLDRSGLDAALGDLEADLMELVWSRPEGQAVTVREIWQDLYPSHPVMYTTVMNTMTRLARKGLLGAERKGIAFAYTPSLSRQAFIDRFVGSALERLLTNFGGATLDRLKQVDDPEVQSRLAQLLEEVAQRRPAEEKA
ncbi:MAG: BlaI/MecI/CopY family transcriptional regulator [Chloroflexota bacterium]